MTHPTTTAALVTALVVLLGATAPMRPGATSRALGPAGVAPWRRRRSEGAGGTDRSIAWIALATVTAALVTLPLAALPPVAWWAHRHTHDRRQVRGAARHLEMILPDTVDLLLLCTGAGWSLPLAQPLVARRSPAPLGEALAAADRAAERGQMRADALLGALAPLGDQARALGQVLADHLRYGVPLGAGLERLGLELRLERRRAAEQEARKVPVRLLAPLVLCVLPAFALLSVVPLLAASLRALPT